MVYIVLAMLIFGLDIFFKNKIEKKEKEDFPVKLAGGICLEKHHNKGFIMNNLDNRPDIVRLVSIATMIPLFFWFAWLFIKKAGSISKTGAAFLLGGAFSNVWDRLTRGYVVDYLRLPIKKIRHIIFNIADFFIFLGALLSAIYGFFSK